MPGPTGFPLAPVTFKTADGHGSFSKSVPARAVVRIIPGGGPSQVFNIKSFTIDKNCHGATNTASFVLPYTGNPDWTQMLYRGDGAVVLDNTPIYAEIWAGFPANPSPDPITTGLSRRFYGIADLYTPKDMETTEFHLRSIAAPLCTDRVSSAVQNKTTIQLLKEFAAQYKIQTNIDPDIKNPYQLSQVYAQEGLVGLKQLIKWDVLLKCAIADDTDIWEDDGILNYYYAWKVPRQTLQLAYGTNVKSFNGTHSPQFNRNIEVFVHSYTQKIRFGTTVRARTHTGADGPGTDITTSSKTSYRNPQFGTNNATTTTYYSNGTVSVTSGGTIGGPTSGSTSAISESGKEKYYFVRNNYTAQMCEDTAKKLWRQISMHEYQADITIPMTPQALPLVKITSLLDFSGYGMTFFNTKYWPRSFQEKFEGAEAGSDTAAGWDVTFHAVNHTPPVGGV